MYHVRHPWGDTTMVYHIFNTYSCMHEAWPAMPEQETGLPLCIIHQVEQVPPTTLLRGTIRLYCIKAASLNPILLQSY